MYICKYDITLTLKMYAKCSSDISNILTVREVLWYSRKKETL